MYMFLTGVTGFVQAPSELGFGFGASSLVAGLCLVPFSVSSLLGSRRCGRLAPAGRLPRVLAGGTSMVAAGGVFFALGHTALWSASR